MAMLIHKINYGNGTVDFMVTYILLVKLYFLLLALRKGIWTYLFPNIAEVQKGIIPFWRLHFVISRIARITFVLSFVIACWFKLK